MTISSVPVLQPASVAGLLVVDMSPVSTSPEFKEYYPKLMEEMSKVVWKEKRKVHKAQKAIKKQLKHIIKDDVTMKAILNNINVTREGSIGWMCNLEVLKKQFKHLSSFPKSLKGKNYDGPTMFIGGQVSEYLPADDLPGIREMFPRAVIKYVVSTGHNVHAEDPKAFMELLIDQMKAVDFSGQQKSTVTQARGFARQKLLSSGMFADGGGIQFILMNIGKRGDTIGWMCNLDALKQHFTDIATFPEALKSKQYDGPSDLVSSLIIVDISPVKTSPQIFSMANLFDAMSSVSVRPGIAMSKARKLADEQLKSITPDVNLRNFLITNLVQTNTGAYTWRVNLPALKENFQSHISNFPSNLKGLQYCGPTLFIGGSLSDYIGKNDLRDIQEYFPLADLVFVEGAGHWVHSQKPEKFLDLPPEYTSNGIDLNNRFGDDASERIPLKELAQPPRLDKAKQLPHDADFSLFLPRHQEMATEVIDALMNVPENQLQDFLSTCTFARVNLNPQLFNYCYSVALMHRRDTRSVPIQNFAETFPSKFLDSKVFSQAREVARVTPQGAARNPIIIPRDYTATDLEEEHRLAYFREDIGVNLHHWHWHLVYPFTASDRAIVAKDRRGELFFYMHQQIIARYNGERLNNSLKRVKKFGNWREPIPEAYYPKLDSLTSSRGWPPRQAGMRWQNINRPVDGINVTLDQMEEWRRRLEDAVSTGRVRLPNGSFRPLDIDTLGNMLEASILSPNIDYYGSVHNNGHTFSAYVHDPDHRYLLENPGVEVTSATIESQGGQNNTLNTFWMQSDVDLSRGLDFSNRGPVARRATVRIFISPKNDERNLPWHLNDQRKMFIEMDRFTFRDLSAQGEDPRKQDLASFNFCGCGWPQHMLVPKGTEGGMPYQLFVDQPDGTELTCDQASSFCGLKDRLFPDKRAMGFPFDRPSASFTNITDFSNLPNMALTDITIKFQNTTEITHILDSTTNVQLWHLNMWGRTKSRPLSFALEVGSHPFERGALLAFGLYWKLCLGLCKDTNF
ncbi:hypothetical protein MSG28_005853 [Choristoneura fumiferana]|uniref:Uncharacterized protein n=1 Tax=Choristoneura fumiferana TaxID=7141 RepID=A0ACC0L110_CHOFU|nr:hypothetical protein MSG28_005853 [Choristoneura fumiferana]